MLDPKIRLKPLKSDKAFDIHKHRNRIMKLIQEQVDKLREGKATLVADHSKPEMMKKVFTKGYPKSLRLFSYDELGGLTGNSIGELIHLVDFFEEKEKEIKKYIEPELIKAGDERVLLGMLRTPPKRDVRVVEEENYKLLIKPPKTPEERDQIVNDLQAIDFPKELPSDLSLSTIDLSSDEETLIKLLRMRDVYRDGWVSDTISTIDNYCIEFCENKLNIDRYRNCSSSLSFQDEKTAELFLSNFKEYLEQVKHLIS